MKQKKSITLNKYQRKESKQREDPEYESMGDAIRENSDDNRDEIEELLIEYQEETQLKPRTYRWKQAYHKKMPMKPYENIHNIHKHS
ncbi:hypothetical protein O181_016198 [Austropuccinia psidii MF-1]|uniref:Uncharacterized protein n=1 Tax=Austropuccinia psidii MF-1 TaxID=1389203 RepID=A0A9Q3GQM9_9BASI|nr:hypothetical protein [Austropuccinia psidii MF-1]